MCVYVCVWGGGLLGDGWGKGREEFYRGGSVAVCVGGGGGAGGLLGDGWGMGGGRGGKSFIVEDLWSRYAGRVWGSGGFERVDCALL